VDELIALERAGWDSLCNGTGGEFYGRVMTADGVMILANGSVMTSDEVVAALGQSPPWVSYEIGQVRTVPLGADATGLLYVGVGHRGGGEPSFVGVMTSVYVRRGDGWALALYQQTPRP